MVPIAITVAGAEPDKAAKNAQAKTQSKAHSAAHIAYQTVGEIYDTAGDTTFGHQISGKHEESDGHNGSGLQSAEDTLCDNGGGSGQTTEYYGAKGSHPREMETGTPTIRHTANAAKRMIPALMLLPPYSLNL